MRILLVLFIVFGFHLAVAQIVPNSNQPFQFASAYNPAFTGVEEFTSLKFGYRQQWVSFPESPQYLNLSFAKRLNQPVDMIHNALYIPGAPQADEIPKGKRIINAIGATLVNQKFGIFEDLDIGITYSLQIPLKKKTYFSIGLAPGYSNSKSQLDKIVTKDPDRLIADLKTQSGSQSRISLRGGILLFSPKFYLHASLLQIWQHTISEGITDQGYHMVAAGGIGFNFDLNAKLTIKPSVAVLVDEYNNFVNDYGFKLYFGDQIWGGLTYRDSGFGIIVLGYEVNHLLGLSYSYELATGNLKGASNGSHEIVIGLKLSNFRRANPYTW